MKLDYVHVADYATVSREGKLSVIGIFKTITCQTVPVVHPLFYICLQFTPEEADLGRANHASVRILDPEHNVLWSAEGPIAMEDNSPLIDLSVHFAIVGQVFPEAGPYLVEAQVDGDRKQTEILVVQQGPNA